jgi:hypothetical protein
LMGAKSRPEKIRLTGMRSHDLLSGFSHGDHAGAAPPARDGFAAISGMLQRMSAVGAKRLRDR